MFCLLLKWCACVCVCVCVCGEGLGGGGGGGWVREQRFILGLRLNFIDFSNV